VGPVPARLEVDDGLLKGMQVIALGPENASLYIYIFYDVYCPYCGMEMTESYKYFEYLAQEYKVILADFLIHESGLESHALLRCAAGQGAPLLEVLDWWYSNILKGKDPGADGLRSQLSKSWEVNVDQLCVDSEKDKVLEVTQAAAQLGVRGTPTLVVYDAKNGRVVDAVVGYLGEDKLKSFIENAVAKAAVSG
jgi:protein-disulfide isomerase